MDLRRCLFEAVVTVMSWAIHKPLNAGNINLTNPWQIHQLFSDPREKIHFHVGLPVLEGLGCSLSMPNKVPTGPVGPGLHLTERSNHWTISCCCGPGTSPRTTRKPLNLQLLLWARDPTSHNQKTIESSAATVGPGPHLAQPENHWIFSCYCGPWTPPHTTLKPFSTVLVYRHAK
jgi:hypothetical protein